MNPYQEDPLVEETEEDALRAFAIGLTMGCPLDQTNPQDCPLRELRHLSLSLRLAWARELSLDELNKIVHDHNACLHQREECCDPQGPE